MAATMPLFTNRAKMIAPGVLGSNFFSIRRIRISKACERPEGGVLWR